jgi:hypothetical protein
MEQTLTRALAAAARAFADEIERDSKGNELPALISRPRAGSRESMIEVLGSVAAINHEQHRGVTGNEMRMIATRAGMDPRGMAGYYTPVAQLLELRDGSRWVTGIGMDRLRSLQSEG